MDPKLNTPISVEEAIHRVLAQTSALPCVPMPLSSNLLGRTLAQDLRANESFPPFAASIMDGYAVVAPLSPGTYSLAGKVHAGQTPDDSFTLSPGEVVYITTGAKVPAGANAVIKVEDTSKVQDNEAVVEIKTGVSVGANIREIGSDIENGEIVMRTGHVLGPSEIGLLATMGFMEVLCYDRPVIGVMSTGDELVDAWEKTPTGSQVRDCNRISLLSAFMEDNFDVLDLGIISDSKEVLRQKLLEAGEKCDVVVTSGGVSMGAADFVKPLLAELGTIHFCKLNMKPGKPTTFASIKRAGENRAGQTLFFGLPGNPVSCLVTKALFVDPALRRLQGLNSEACLHPQLSVVLAGDAIKLDAERPEYHRAELSTAPVDSKGNSIIPHGFACVTGGGCNNIVYAKSTGFQRSSRLLSMLSANALLFLPKGPGTIEAGAQLTALLIRPLSPAPYASSVHLSAASMDFVNKAGLATQSASTTTDGSKAQYESFPRAVTATNASNSDTNSADWCTIKVGLLTVSDRASQGLYPDNSGPEMARLLKEMSDAPDFPLKFVVTNSCIVPDEPEDIRRVVTQWCDPASGSTTGSVDLLLSSGGTGFGLRDVTPEALKPLLHREAPGVAQALLSEGLKHTPLAVLSRPVVGTRYRSLVCTLPGSVKAVRENIVCLKALLPRIMELLKENTCSAP